MLKEVEIIDLIQHLLNEIREWEEDECNRIDRDVKDDRRAFAMRLKKYLLFEQNTENC